MVLFREVVFHGGLVADERDDHVAAARRELLLHKDVVAAQDAGVDHRVAVHLEAEDLAPAFDERTVDAHRVDDVLFGEERQACGHTAKDPDLDEIDVVRRLVRNPVFDGRMRGQAGGPEGA